MEFRQEEMERRLAAVRREMAADEVDCLLITGVENFSYFTSVSVELYQQRRPWCTLIPIAGEPLVITMSGIDETMHHESFFKNVVSYRLPATNIVPLIVDAVRTMRVRTLGCELGIEQRLGLPLNDFDAIRATLSSVALVDAAPILWNVRMYKSEAEIARMKRACDITGATRQALFRLIRPGMTERDVADLWSHLMVAAGADRPSFIFVNSGPAGPFLPKPDKRLASGDTIWIDGGVYVRGYTCDFSRVATLGPGSAKQRRSHDDAVEAVGVVLEHVKPGVSMRELAAVCASEMTKRGYSGFENPSKVVAGHGMGMLINEPPLVAGWDDSLLAPGMVVGVEFGPSNADGMFIWEELVQVNEEGYDLLTTESMELVEIVA